MEQEKIAKQIIKIYEDGTKEVFEDGMFISLDSEEILNLFNVSDFSTKAYIESLFMLYVNMQQK